MVLSKSEIALYAYATGRVLPKGTTRAAFRTAVSALTPIAARAAPVVGSVAANPLVAGTALGLGALATPPGQDLLQAAAERGAADRIALQQLIDQSIFRATTLPQRQITEGLANPAVKSAVRRKTSKYGKAIKAGMAAVKKSKFGGKPGKITNAKSTFSTVSKVTSAINKGRKVSPKGIRGTIARSVRRILK